VAGFDPVGPGDLVEQLTTRDAALLTWAGVLTLVLGWSAIRGGGVGRAAVDVVRIILGKRILAAILLIGAWQVALVWLASKLGLWNQNLLKDTIVIVLAGAFTAGFKALAIAQGKQTWRGELRSLLALVVVLQWVSNLETFPYYVELGLVPLAVLLGGVQAVAALDDRYATARPVINSMVTLLGFAILAWSAWKVLSSWTSNDPVDVALGCALAFWLPAALLPAVFLEALVMEYGSTLSRMNVVRPPTWRARLDLFRHYGFSLSRLHAFSPMAAREYARASSRAERLTILRGTRAEPPNQGS
jgi:hypothetical protein